MNFQQLHELLRLELLLRIEQGALTGTRLAQMTQFRQAHISNFLNKKRSLSLEGLDRMLAAQDLSIEQLLLPSTNKSLPIDIAATAITKPAEDSHTHDPTEIVPVVAASSVAEEPRISSALVMENIHLASSLLTGIRARPSPRSTAWQRFVAIRVSGQHAAEMPSALTPGSIAIIDRHYNSLAPYRVGHATLYAVRYGPGLLLRFLEFSDGRLILRPASIDHPVHLLTVAPDQTPSDFIIGRVCLLVQEL